MSISHICQRWKRNRPADCGVRWAIEGLIERGFPITVPTDLARGIARQIDTVAIDEWTGAAVAIMESSR